MPQVISHENQRIAFRISSEDKAILTKAAELSHTNMTEFMLQLVLPKAREIVQQHEQKTRSQRDFVKIMDLLDNPPPINSRLQRAIQQVQEQYHE